MAAGTLLTCFGAALYGTITSQYVTRSEEEDYPIAIAEESGKVQQTYIYRRGGTNIGNLVPRLKDVGEGLYPGLSFSLIPSNNSWRTSIEAVNATGNLMAINDHGSHVSVFPIDGTMEQWVAQGKSSIWTMNLMVISVKIR